MTKVSNQEKAKYTRLNPESEKCYYCGNDGVMDDMTPSPKASEPDKALFLDPWTIARVCRSCWGKIYTANIAAAGAKFFVPKGCMTVQHKQSLFGIADREESEYVVNRSCGLITHIKMLKAEGGSFMLNGQTFSIEELKALQGPLLALYVKLPMDVVQIAFQGAMASGFLDMDREAEYKSMLKLSEEDKKW